MMRVGLLDQLEHPAQPEKIGRESWEAGSLQLGQLKTGQSIIFSPQHYFLHKSNNKQIKFKK